MAAKLESNKIGRYLGLVIALNALSVVIALVVYAYQGLFVRYMSDDYCHGGLFLEYGFFEAIKIHYLNVSDRYMILVIPYLTEYFGSPKYTFLPGLLIVLWVIALAWLLKEVGELFSVHWSRLVYFLFAGLSSFFVILQAPDQYQSVFWEVGSVVHFVPMIWTTFLVSSVLSLIRGIQNNKPYFLWSVLYFILTLLIGGFSEMNDALIVVLAFFSFAGIFLWVEKGYKRFFSLWITGSILFASLMSMLVMALSPGNAIRVSQSPTLLMFLQRILTYPIDFIVNTLKTLPFPSMLAVLIFMMTVFLLSQEKQTHLPPMSNKKMLAAFFAAPIFLYVFLATNFSPSAYTLGYPADRALLEARYLMTLLLAFEGTLLGFAFSQSSSAVFRSKRTKYATMLLLAIFAFYPLRTALRTSASIHIYQQRAKAWDLRDADIRAERDAGVKDIITQEFDSLHGIKEIDSDPAHWVNRCAARYYGVDSISAQPLGLRYGK